jgi:hypothetical protein
MSPPRARKSAIRTDLLLAAACLGIIAALYGGYVWLEAAFEPLGKAYESGVAEARARDAATRWVKATGKWPTTWDELERYPPDVGIPLSPEEWARIRDLVQIDFGVTLDEAAEMDPENFRPIRAIAPAVDVYRTSAVELIKALRASQTEKIDPREAAPVDESLD